MTAERSAAFLNAPEIQIAIFALLLNLPWEFWQSPFFAGLAHAQHWQAVVMCTKAAFGDVVIPLIAFWSVCAVAGTRRWVTHPTRWQKIVFIAVGLLVTVVMELLSTRVFYHWSYAEEMPMLPGIGIGLSPVLQWLLLPPLILWFVRRQLK